ncbi:hypothetical protein C8R46DRAFT_1040959 [Mycena filopes]|nr:hypothetical protein C8R46DRAFT_1040959 [Mycena filopes]
MQFTIFVVAALLAASPALAGDFTFFTGAGCTGSIFASANDVPTGDCVFLTNGGSAKSIGYSNVPNQINFFESGGAHDGCSNGATLTMGGPNGCATAPDGFNWESLSFD